MVSQIRTIRYTRGSRSMRRAAAAVELAIVLPMLLIMVFGTIEVCQRIFLRQSAVICAYEGIRLAARRASTSSDVTSRCQSLLTERRVNGGTVTLTPTVIGTLPTGSQISVRIEVPWANNTVTRFVLQSQGNVVVEATMLRE